jgi:DNA-binding MarR family transcriptional regulator
VSGAERDIRARLEGHELDFVAMSAVSNIYRTGAAVRNHMERTVLAEYDLSWVAFTVLWVLCHVAAEAGITKGTLTGVIKTLQSRKLIRRIPHRDDRRRVSIGLTRAGTRMIEEVFPQFNQQESLAVSTLSATDQLELARLLRLVLAHIHDVDENEGVVTP